ncbi:MAG: S8 family peptidase [Promethearchaeota archaeon]
MRNIDDFQISKVESELLGKFCLKNQISPTDTHAQKFYSDEKIRVIITFESDELQEAWLKKSIRNTSSIEILTKSTLTQIPMVVAISTYSTIRELSKIKEKSLEYIRNIYLDRNLYLSSLSSSSTSSSKLTDKLANLSKELGLDANCKIPIAVIDSGVDSKIEKINQNIEMMLNYSKEEKSLGGSDHNGHGTYISSILINSLQTSKNDPISSKSPITNPSAAKIYSIKIFTKDGKAHLSDLVFAMGEICFQPETHNQIFVEGNVKIILIPVSTTPTTGYNDLFSPILEFFNSHQILCICSAGNFGPESIGLGYPGSLQNILNVGSITDSGKSAFYSSRGLAEDGSELPKFYDYGKNIRGIATPNGKFCSIPQSGQKGISITGTSTSAALVAAKVGLIKFLNPSYSISDLGIASQKTFPIRNILRQLGWIKDDHKSLIRMILQSLGFSVLMIAIFIIAIKLL